MKVFALSMIEFYCVYELCSYKCRLSTYYTAQNVALAYTEGKLIITPTSLKQKSIELLPVIDAIKLFNFVG